MPDKTRLRKTIFSGFFDGKTLKPDWSEVYLSISSYFKKCFLQHGIWKMVTTCEKIFFKNSTKDRMHVFILFYNGFLQLGLSVAYLSWIQLQGLLRCCLLHTTIIILRHILHLGFCVHVLATKSMLRLCDSYFIFSLIFIIINHIIW